MPSSVSSTPSRKVDMSEAAIAQHNRRLAQGDYGKLPSQPSVGIARKNVNTSAILATQSDLLPKLWSPEGSKEALKASLLANDTESAKSWKPTQSAEAATAALHVKDRARSTGTPRDSSVSSWASQAALQAHETPGDQFATKYLKDGYAWSEKVKQGSHTGEWSHKPSTVSDASRDRLAAQGGAAALRAGTTQLLGAMDISKIEGVARDRARKTLANVYLDTSKNRIQFKGADGKIVKDHDPADNIGDLGLWPRQNVINIYQIASAKVKSDLQQVDRTVAEHRITGTERDRQIAFNIANANLEKRTVNHGKIDLGGGLFISQNDVDEVARRNVQPVLNEVSKVAEDRREADRVHAEEQEALRLAREEQKTRERAEREESRRLAKEKRDEERAANAVKKAEERERKAKEKAEAAAKKNEERHELEAKEASGVGSTAAAAGGAASAVPGIGTLKKLNPFKGTTTGKSDAAAELEEAKKVHAAAEKDKEESIQKHRLLKVSYHEKKETGDPEEVEALKNETKAAKADRVSKESAWERAKEQLELAYARFEEQRKLDQQAIDAKQSHVASEEADAFREKADTDHEAAVKEDFKRRQDIAESGTALDLAKFDAQQAKKDREHRLEALRKAKEEVARAEEEANESIQRHRTLKKAYHEEKSQSEQDGEREKLDAVTKANAAADKAAKDVESADKDVADRNAQVTSLSGHQDSESGAARSSGAEAADTTALVPASEALVVSDNQEELSSETGVPKSSGLDTQDKAVSEALVPASEELVIVDYPGSGAGETSRGQAHTSTSHYATGGAATSSVGHLGAHDVHTKASDAPLMNLRMNTPVGEKLHLKEPSSHTHTTGGDSDDGAIPKSAVVHEAGDVGVIKAHDTKLSEFGLRPEGGEDATEKDPKFNELKSDDAGASHGGKFDGFESSNVVEGKQDVRKSLFKEVF